MRFVCLIFKVEEKDQTKIKIYSLFIGYKKNEFFKNIFQRIDYHKYEDEHENIKDKRKEPELGDSNGQ